MEKERVKEVIESIEHKMELENHYWKNGNERMAEYMSNKIDGMLEALTILTGVKYTVNKDGKIIAC